MKDMDRKYVGQRFGRLTVIKYLPGGIGRHARALCQCDCGKQCTPFVGNLKRGLTRSCGCLNDETRVIVNTKHGMTESPEHHVWATMIQRCTNPNHGAYPHYGGRGINICQAWLRFEQFLADMGPRPSMGHSLERKNNDGNYEPGNCKWATRKEQCRNRRSNRVIEYQGESKTLAEWAELYGLQQSTLSARIRYGWPIHRALTAPLRQWR